MIASSRDPVTGRFVSTRNTPESGEGKFRTYVDDLPVEMQGADPADLAYGTEHRHAPEGDDLAQGGQSSPWRPRTAKLISDRYADTTELHARPDRATLHADTMREAAGPDAGDLDPVHYLVGNITGIQE
jgi:hypothetical protein